VEINKDIKQSQILQNPKQLAELISVLAVDPVKALDSGCCKNHKDQRVSKSDMLELLHSLNNVPHLKNSLAFGFSDDENLLLVQIRDRETDDLIRQYPSEEFLGRLRYYREHIGILLDDRA